MDAGLSLLGQVGVFIFCGVDGGASSGLGGDEGEASFQKPG
jgi:hypothetical protein